MNLRKQVLKLEETLMYYKKDFEDLLSDELTDCLVQSRYKTEDKQNGKKSFRSSLWRFENNQWRLFFHQGMLTI